MSGQPGFFDLSDRYAALSAAGDPLERLAAVVEFAVFCGPLVAALRRGPRNKGGRPPFDPVPMFKILVLQALYSLSDEATAGRTTRSHGYTWDDILPGNYGGGAHLADMLKAGVDATLLFPSVPLTVSKQALGARSSAGPEFRRGNSERWVDALLPYSLSSIILREWHRLIRLSFRLTATSQLELLASAHRKRSERTGDGI